MVVLGIDHDDDRPPAEGRRVVTLHPAVAAEYTRIVAEVAPAVEAFLSPRVLANRVALAEPGVPRLLLRAWRLERQRYRARLRRLVGATRSVLITDVRRCYPSIGPAAVGRALGDVDADDRSVRAIVGFLDRPAFGGGLPVGPAPSAVLANAVLAGVDLRLQASGLEHLRWVDDVVVALPAPSAALAAVAAIDEALADVGLERHHGKTRIVAPTDVLAVGVSGRSA